MRPHLPYEYMPPVSSFTLTSDDLTDRGMLAEEHVYDGFGLPGHNLSPHLAWHGFPAETRSFAVTCLDPDAPTGSGFWHWVLFDIPMDVTELPRGAGQPGSPDLPAGAQHARNDMGIHGYCGAAPPKGDEPHRYVFAVHALDCERLGPDADASPAVVGYNTTMHVIARALTIPVFGH
jgi:Raf kinase inhibitor-like YbhB/YbcL family protein